MTAAMPSIRARLETELSRRSAAGGENSVDGPEQVTRTGDRGDLAQVEQSVRLEAGLAAVVIRERMAIRRAIDRIDAGEYGICLGCHDMIPARRLDSIPWAARCVDCQQQWEALQIA